MITNPSRCRFGLSLVLSAVLWATALVLFSGGCAFNSETPPSPGDADDKWDGGGSEHPRDDTDFDLDSDSQTGETDSDDGTTGTDEQGDGNGDGEDAAGDTDSDSDDETDPDDDGPDHSSTDLSFMVIGDTHGGRNISTQKQVAEAMDDVAAQYEPDLVIHAGDITDHGLKGNAASFFENYYVGVYRDLSNLAQVPFYGVLGNHDYCGSVDDLMDYQSNGWRMDDHVWKHTLTVGGIDIAFVHVDTNVLAYYNGMEDWLLDSCPKIKIQFDEKTDAFGFGSQWIIDRTRALLDDVSYCDYIFVVGHHPVGGGPCGAKGDLQKLKKLVGDFNVTAYFSGHVHVMDFGRDASTLFVSTGTSGTQGGSGCLENDGWKNGMWQGAEPGFVLATISDHELEIRFMNESGVPLIKESAESRSAGYLPECNDQAPDNRFTCEEQMGFGKCGEDWMVGFCCATCFNCSGECLGA